MPHKDKGQSNRDRKNKKKNSNTDLNGKYTRKYIRIKEKTLIKGLDKLDKYKSKLIKIE